MTAPTEEVEVLDFSSGASIGEEFKKKEDAARQAARGSQSYLTLKNDQESVILRFLFEANQMGMDRTQPVGPNNPWDPTTGWILAKDHFAKTKSAPRDKPAESTWPEQVSAICRRTPLGPNQTPAFPNCYICDNIKNDRGKPEMPTVAMWASAVLREEVIGSQELVDAGRIDASQIGQRLILDQGDWVDEVDNSGTTTGKKVWKKRYVIVDMAMSNFFGPLVTLADYWGTILDRDYKITRKGEPRARRVEYVPVALAPYQVSVMRDGAVKAIDYDLREPEIAALYADSKLTRADITKIISRKISKAYYDRFFDISVEVPWKDPSFSDDAASTSQAAAGPAAPPPPPAPTPQQQAGQSLTQEPTAGVTADQLAAMRNKVMGGNTAPESTPESPPAPPAPVSTPTSPAPAATAAAAAPPPLVGTPAPQQS